MTTEKEFKIGFGGPTPDGSYRGYYWQGPDQHVVRDAAGNEQKYGNATEACAGAGHALVAALNRQARAARPALDELDVIYAGPTVGANRVFVSEDEGRTRIVFAEQAQPERLPVFRCGVSVASEVAGMLRELLATKAEVRQRRSAELQLARLLAAASAARDELQDVLEQELTAAVPAGDLSRADEVDENMRPVIDGRQQLIDELDAGIGREPSKDPARRRGD